jgi:homoserine dehydrogenase
VKVRKGLLTKDLSKVLYDPEIDIVVELIGGIHPAKDIILEAIRQGKHVVTANKALLSEAGKEIFDLANRCGVCVGLEASVGGGIPIIRAFKEGFIANRLDLVYGIINGTSNFILTKMEDEGLSFKEALELARAEGYAERNPILDTGGMDSAHKLSVLAYLGFGLAARPNEIFTEGILDIEPLDIHYARELGYAVRLLAIAKRSGRNLELRVHPTLLRKEHLLASVKGIYNAIFVKGDLVGETLFYGEGAGRFPTSSSVVSDIVSIGRGISESCRAEPCFGFKKTVERIAKIDTVKVRHYIRFSAIDKPGVLKRIAGVLARHRISIASVTQKEERREKAVPIVMMTHEAEERAMREALDQIARLDVIKRKPVRIRIED